MNILAIETATEACSVALSVGDDVQQRYEHQPQQQANLVLPMIDELMREAGLKPAQLDAVAFGRGPGSFTGLRIATAVTQGIAVAADLPVVPVSTPAALARGAYRKHGIEKILTAVDARMSEVYWAVYRVNDLSSGVELEGDELVLPPGEVPLPAGGGVWLGAGSGWRAYADILSAHAGDRLRQVDDGLWPQALDVLALGRLGLAAGEGLPAEQADPVYIRDKVALSVAERRRIQS